jgi:hypothetical protein
MTLMKAELLHGDCVDLMRAMPECSVDSGRDGSAVRVGVGRLGGWARTFAGRNAGGQAAIAYSLAR